MNIGGSSRASAGEPPEVIRAEIFSAERLEQHAGRLAATHRVTARPVAARPLITRLHDNRRALLEAHRTIASAIAHGDTITPAAEWLVDNYHVVEAQIRQIGDDLPPGYYRQLPKLAEGPLAGYPRMLGVAWEFVAHTDSRFDAHLLARFVTAYQEVQPLTIGELWAIAITLRIVLVENLRRAAGKFTGAIVRYATPPMARASRHETSTRSRLYGARIRSTGAPVCIALTSLRVLSGPTCLMGSVVR